MVWCSGESWTGCLGAGWLDGGGPLACEGCEAVGGGGIVVSMVR